MAAERVSPHPAALPYHAEDTKSSRSKSKSWKRTARGGRRSAVGGSSQIGAALALPAPTFHEPGASGAVTDSRPISLWDGEITPIGCACQVTNTTYCTSVTVPPALRRNQHYCLTDNSLQNRLPEECTNPGAAGPENSGGKVARLSAVGVRVSGKQNASLSSQTTT